MKKQAEDCVPGRSECKNYPAFAFAQGCLEEYRSDFEFDCGFCSRRSCYVRANNRDLASCNAQYVTK